MITSGAGEKLSDTQYENSGGCVLTFAQLLCRGAFFWVLMEVNEQSANAQMEKKFVKAKVALSHERHEAIFVWAEFSTQVCIPKEPCKRALLHSNET